jgi:hydroxymethylpyrimidine pyrophosphatase-like HAD family hydrolase
MRYAALAVDYDGTLAHDGRVDDATAAALARLRASGRQVILVTGRILPDLLAAFPQVTLCDVVVAENGGLLYWPAIHEQRVLAEPAPEALIADLQARGVAPLSVGRVIVATWQPHETAVLEAIHALGLEHQVIFNKGAVMVLPPSINKGAGLAAALHELGLSPHNVVAIGDAENDHALFTLAECAAVANALPAVKRHADLVLTNAHGAGVVELIDRLVGDDLKDAEMLLRRHDLPLGTGDGNTAIALPAHGVNVLIAGPTGSGKSTLLTVMLERLMGAGYQCCVVDPEGDYEELPGATILGDWAGSPTVDEVTRLLERPEETVVVSLVGTPLAERPAYFAKLRAGLLKLRTLAGHPHWLALDEAHHVLPRWGEYAVPELFAEMGETILVTVEPGHLPAEALAKIDVVIATGESSAETVAGFCRAIGQTIPATPAAKPSDGQVLVWFRRERPAPQLVQLIPAHAEHRRHRRKYAQGELEPARSFYFRGPAGHLNLRASNLLHFLELADRVDDDVWFYHLRRGDFAHWYRDVIRDDVLAEEAARGEALVDAAVRESRRLIRRAIESRYTLPT